MLYIGEDFIPCVFMLQVVHVQDVHDHPVDNLYLAINLGVEGCGLNELRIQQQ